MSLRHYFTLALLGAFLIACDGKKSDPKTVTPSDLNPPNGLVTISGSAETGITLHWKAANTEEGFQGYNVFAVKKSLADVQALPHTYPSTVDLATGSIPRCADNTAVFQASNLPLSEADCEGAEEEEGEAAGGDAG